MTARTVRASGEVANAGAWAPIDSRAAVSDSAGISYAHHSASGTKPTGPDRAAWTVEWVAPAAGGTVHFHVAANSGNGDNSPLGDLVYVAAAEVARAER